MNMSVTAFLEGGGDTRAEIRAFDWSQTPLGHPETWPRSLKTPVSAMLAYPQAALVAWGPDLRVLYNEEFHFDPRQSKRTYWKARL